MMLLTAVFSIIGWIAGCTIRDLDLHIKEGAFRGQLASEKSETNTAPSAPLP